MRETQREPTDAGGALKWWAILVATVVLFFVVWFVIAALGLVVFPGVPETTTGWLVAITLGVLILILVLWLRLGRTATTQRFE